MLFKFAPIALFAATVVADGASILSSLATIDKDTIALNSSVASWNGEFLSVSPILLNSDSLNDDLQAATVATKNSTVLTTTETLSIVAPSQKLVSDVESTLETLIAAKPKFDALIIADSLVLSLLQELKSSADSFTAAVVSKVPTAYQSVAEGIVAPVDTYFDYAIGNYSTGF